MNTLARVLKKIDAFTRAVLQYISLSMFVILMLIIALNVLNRLIPFTSFHWLDEIIELCFAAMTFYGATAVWITRGHYSVGNWVEKSIKNNTGAGIFRIGIELVSLGFFVILFKYSLSLVLKTRELTAVFQLPRSVLYSCMPIASAIMILYSLSFIVSEILAIARKNREKSTVQ